MRGKRIETSWKQKKKKEKERNRYIKKDMRIIQK